jgi:hypothetical protein
LEKQMQYNRRTLEERFDFVWLIESIMHLLDHYTLHSKSLHVYEWYLYVW